MSRFLIYILALLCTVAVLKTTAQQMVEGYSQEIYHIPAPISSDNENAQVFAKERISQLQQEGYLSATKDSIVLQDEEFAIFITPGRKYYYKVNELHISDMALYGSNLQHITKASPVAFDDFETELKRIIDFYAAKGHPFARIEKKNVQITDNEIWLDLIANPSERILFDTISIAGDAKLNRHFTENFLGIIAGNLFNEKLVNDAEKRLQELDFAELSGPVQLSFSPGLASLILPLKNIPSNRFDGIAGFAGGADPETPFQVTGLLNLYLSNAMGMGENIDIEWQGPGSGTQILNINGSYPYPLRLPLETELMFALHKQDTSWLQMQLKPALFFGITSGSKIGVFWHYTANNLISTQNWQNADNTAPNLDFRMNLYGIEYRYRTRAFYRQLLQGGFIASLRASGGIRKIVINNNLPENIYDETELRQTRVNALVHMEKRWQTGPRATLSVANRTGYINGQNLPRNELFRLGGFKTLRGFDELSIIASAYSMADIEFRFFTAPRSFFSFFANGGWYQQDSGGKPINDFPLGFGTGLNLQTPPGIFSINLALGLRKDVSPEFRNAKVHVGYISNF
ncbi:MAG: hypothetical protein EA361_11530 [Bacteroidetes bacterium]|nr:MAG: hypothetical protein EA361_11530 [Bacteroidota bacterium]